MSRHDYRCPTCGKFTDAHGYDGYGDLPPDGYQDVDCVVVYCNEKCAERKSPPAHYFDENYEYHTDWKAGSAV